MKKTKGMFWFRTAPLCVKVGEIMAGKKVEEIVRCSFCGKTQAQVRKMIAGPNDT